MRREAVRTVSRRGAVARRKRKGIRIYAKEFASLGDCATAPLREI
jgi:DNA-binding FadR family transcriptional regulator